MEWYNISSYVLTKKTPLKLHLVWLFMDNFSRVWSDNSWHTQGRRKVWKFGGAIAYNYFDADHHFEPSEVGF